MIDQLDISAELELDGLAIGVAVGGLLFVYWREGHSDARGGTPHVRLRHLVLVGESPSAVPAPELGQALSQCPIAAALEAAAAGWASSSDERALRRALLALLGQLG